MHARAPGPGRRGGFVAAALTLLVVGVMMVANAPSAGAASPTQPAAATSACPKLNLPTPICHVFVVFFENEEFYWVNRNWTEFHLLGAQYALAGDYYSVKHYSFPNYVAATSGHATNYIAPIKTKNLGSLIENANVSLTWRAYMQSMPYACDENTTTPEFRLAHNPFTQYANILSNRTSCAKHDTGFPAWNAAVASGQVPNYAFFSPNGTDDCWKSGFSACNQWLRSWLPPLLNDSFFASSVFFLTFDEGTLNDTAGVNNTTGGGHVYTSVISPYACAHKVSTYDYNAFDILTSTEWLLNLGRTGVNDSWSAHPPMRDLFCFSSGGAGTPRSSSSTASHGATPAAIAGLARWTEASIGRVPLRLTVLAGPSVASL